LCASPNREKSPTAATIEHVTYAPALNNLPTLNDDSTASARASLAGFTNGQTGAANPNRQGLNSAILDKLDFGYKLEASLTLGPIINEQTSLK